MKYLLASVAFVHFTLFTLFTLFSHNTVAGEIRAIALHVEGMTCASCPLTVKQLLKRQPGVTEATVDYKSGIAHVKFDADKIQPGPLAKAVTDAGFPTTFRQ